MSKEDQRWLKYQQAQHGSSIDNNPTTIEARQLTGSESVKCPKSNKIWIGVKGDWALRLPSGNRPDAFKKNADGEPVTTTIHGACYVVKESVFISSYVAVK